jgi:hypothetical protein
MTALFRMKYLVKHTDASLYQIQLSLLTNGFVIVTCDNAISLRDRFYAVLEYEFGRVYWKICWVEEFEDISPSDIPDA